MGSAGHAETGLLGMVVVFGSIARLLLRAARTPVRGLRFGSRPCCALRYLVPRPDRMAVGLLGGPAGNLVGVLALKVLYANVMYPLDG
jgi:hypothetical protein